MYSADDGDGNRIAQIHGQRVIKEVALNDTCPCNEFFRGELPHGEYLFLGVFWRETMTIRPRSLAAEGR